MARSDAVLARVHTGAALIALCLSMLEKGHNTFSFVNVKIFLTYFRGFKKHKVPSPVSWESGVRSWEERRFQVSRCRARKKKTPLP